jgi:hypothetical protein
MSTRLVSYCGLVCSECPAFVATQAGDEDLARKTAEQWSRDYGVTVRLEDVWCDGCTTAGRKCGHCGECQMRACAIQRGVATCAACDEYACVMLRDFFAMVPAAKATLDALRTNS